jgi:hypothetical protein
MLNENGLTFKDFEKKTFKMICRLGREYTKDFLERYDTYLMETRDKEAYRNKGKKKTTVKTVYGEVEYERRIYQTTREDGMTEFVYLLDEQLEISGVGLISMNMAEQMVSSITEMSYRETAEKITEMTGQSISAMGVWNVIQSLGDRVCEEERELVKAHKAGQVKGDKKAPVLFEETDGVYVRLQREKQDKGEIKVGIAYDGWKKTGRDRYALDGKVVVAGFSKSKEFQEYREATISQTYNLDETDIRIMNADGAEWVKNICEADTVFQLDPFHRNKAIKENIPYPQAANAIHELLNQHDIEGVFEYLEIYKNSVNEEEEIEKAGRLITYFKNNREGLIPYTEKGLSLPENKQGLVYRNMGTMENHVWSIIAKRMKHNHSCWSIKGGNNLAKILAKKCSGKLNEVASKLKMPIFEQAAAEKIENDILMAGQIKKKTGKGYEYPMQGSLIYLYESLEGKAHQAWKYFAGV